MKKIIFSFIFSFTFILGTFVLFSITVQAKVVHVSQTFKIKIPHKIKSEATIFSLGSLFYKINEPPNASNILVVYAKPPTYANKFSVERYWKESQTQTKPFDKNKKDYGCEKKTERFYQCSRDVNQDRTNMSEMVFWNTNNDLVLVRVTSNSLVESRRILNQLKAVPDSSLTKVVK